MTPITQGQIEKHPVCVLKSCLTSSLVDVVRFLPAWKEGGSNSLPTGGGCCSPQTRCMLFPNRCEKLYVDALSFSSSCLFLVLLPSLVRVFSKRSKFSPLLSLPCCICVLPSNMFSLYGFLCFSLVFMVFTLVSWFSLLGSLFPNHSARFYVFLVPPSLWSPETHLSRILPPFSAFPSSDTKPWEPHMALPRLPPLCRPGPVLALLLPPPLLPPSPLHGPRSPADTYSYLLS